MSSNNKFGKRVVDRFNMTGHKLLWHLDRLQAWQRGERVAPLHIEMGVASGCNLACKYCYGTVIGKTSIGEQVLLPKNVFCELLKDAESLGVRSISLVGEGENTIHPDLYDMLECCRKSNIDFGIATNGIALKESRLLEFLESFVWVRFSIGAANRDIYKIVHGKDRFGHVIDIIRKSVELKKEYNLPVTIGTQMVIIRDNMFQIFPLARLSKDLGVDYFVAKPCSDTPDGKLNVKHEEYYKLEPILREAEKLATNEYDVVMKRNKLLNMGKNDFKVCYGTQFNMTINANGDVAPCGHLLGYRKDEFYMGNIKETSFSDIVEGDRYWEVQRKVQTLNVNKECETNCLHHYINDFLYTLKNPPPHINFV